MATKMLAALTAVLAVAGCASDDGAGEDAPPPVYKGVETRLLDDDLVSVTVSMEHPRGSGDLDQYADCAAAQYALIRGYGFARHVRTNLSEEGGVQRADAVYTISSALPDGLRTVDAEVTVQNCREQGIPTV